MLTFNDRQMDAFAQARLKSFAETLSTRARQIHAAATAEMDDAVLQKTMEQAIRAAKSLGYERQSELERFADLTLALKPGFETSEDWAKEIFARENMRPAEKLSEVEGCAVFIIRGAMS